ncbi:het domain-containing [Fusarium longipes]|uniref:Het domain-containing n=1 Tax=Fusarium longipes TaxID=694270 RepID=A0A395SZ69_9HYPO|nr:het domain-containing [Fusarium longipes]
MIADYNNSRSSLVFSDHDLENPFVTSSNSDSREKETSPEPQSFSPIQYDPSICDMCNGFVDWDPGMRFMIYHFDWEKDTEEAENIVELVAHQVAYDDEYGRKKNRDRSRLKVQLAAPTQRARLAGRIVLFSKHGDKQRINYYSHGVRIKVLTSDIEQAENMDGVLGTLITTDEDLNPASDHRPSRDLLSEPHLRLVNLWRQECSSHSLCNKRSLKSVLPSRVVQILPSSGKLPEASVIETRNIAGEHEYVCLSYCWGKSVQKTMTTCNIFPRPLVLEELPKTIADTVLLCHALGYKYLWVDSLCIIQGNSGDWHKESSVMCDIYGGSALTISTPICDDSAQSFLEKRQNTRYFSGPRLRLKSPGQSSSTPRSMLLPLKSDASPSKTWNSRLDWSKAYHYLHEDVKPDAWTQWAWTYQEWLLSPRVLHIDEMTQWDCFERYGNEMTRRKTEPAIKRRNQVLLGDRLSWSKTIEQFSAKKITYENDRLPALAGIARLYQQKTGRTYIAGLWAEDGPEAFAWRKKCRRSKRSPGFLQGFIPSWSWASTEAEVAVSEGYHNTACCSLKAWACEYDPPGSLLQVKNAWIEIEGPLAIVTYCKLHAEADHQEFDTCIGTADGTICEEVYLDDDNWNLEVAVATKKIYLMLLGDGDRKSSAKTLGLRQTVTTDNNAEALILQETSTAGSIRQFQRVGVAVYDGKVKPWEEQELIRIV